MTIQIWRLSLVAAGSAASVFLSSHATAAELPVSLKLPALPIEVIDLVSVPGPDYPALFAEDWENDDKGGAFRFAIPTDVSINPRDHGTWENTTDGRML